jgi:hypothetical protein
MLANQNIPEPGEPTNRSLNGVYSIGDRPIHVTPVPKTRKLTPEVANEATNIAVQAFLRMHTALMTTEDGSGRWYQENL